MKLKLGKKAFVHDKRDLKMAMYLDKSKLPAVPETSTPYIAYQGDWYMLGNDQLGDCVWAGAGHEHMMWNAEVGKPEIFPTENIIKAYSEVAGYDPNDPNTDGGTIVRDALKYRQKVGILDKAGNAHKLTAYLQIHPRHFNELKLAVYLFDAVGIGIDFPNSAMEQMDKGQPWDVVEGAQSEGGHYVPVVGYDKDYIYCITWGKVQKMTYKFYETYNDEAWALLATDFINEAGKSPDGFDIDTLKADLIAVKNI